MRGLTKLSSALEVLRVFFKLGLGSFGGPVAHIGYFRQEFVVRRRWLDENAYADLVGLCQFLPGPASSQVGFSIGLMRAGFGGGLAAWAGFTLPSAIALTSIAYGFRVIHGPVGAAVLHGLQLVPVAIVAQAVLGMARTLTPDLKRAGIATLAAIVILFFSNPLAQVAALGLGGLLGSQWCRGIALIPAARINLPLSRAVGVASLILFLLLLFASFGALELRGTSSASVLAAFYRSGALVFGGGHVILPLLREAFVVPGWVSNQEFLSGYGAAQAMPGPLFSFAAYLGAVVNVAPRGTPGAALGLIAIYLPGILILIGTLPFWQTWRAQESPRAIMHGVNAAVVGLLAAALYDPIVKTSITTASDLLIALMGLALLVIWRAAPLLVITVTVLCALVAGVLLP